MPPRRTARPLAVAITGGIGAGKTTALIAFARHGAAVVSSDQIVHGLIANDLEVRAALLERFGDRILDEARQIDRGAIAEIVFADPAELEFLEQLLHPRVVRDYLEWRESLALLDDPPEVCVTEVPLLYEVGGEARFDAVVTITAPRELREARSRVSDIDGRSSRLISDDEKVGRADFAYDNCGTEEELDAFVVSVLEELRVRVP
jgi:dephospho-CoA kinase